MTPGNKGTLPKNRFELDKIEKSASFPIRRALSEIQGLYEQLELVMQNFSLILQGLGNFELEEELYPHIEAAFPGFRFSEFAKTPAFKKSSSINLKLSKNPSKGAQSSSSSSPTKDALKEENIEDTQSNTGPENLTLGRIQSMDDSVGASSFGAKPTAVEVSQVSEELYPPARINRFNSAASENDMMGAAPTPDHTPMMRGFEEPKLGGLKGKAFSTVALAMSALSAMGSPDSKYSPLNLKQKAISVQGQPNSTGHFTLKLQAPQRLDFAIVYSSPLVEIVETNTMTYETLLHCDDYNFRDEVFDYSRILSRAKKNISAIVECTASDKFVKIIEQKPKVLHLSCHCEWNPKVEKFQLFFETNKLELIRISADQIDQMLNQKDPDNPKSKYLDFIELLILSFPFPESFVKKFLQAGVQSIITVDSEHKVGQESLSKLVCKKMYETLVSGGDLDAVYKSALEVSERREKHLQPCCCCHKHKPDCRWPKFVQRQGPEKVVFCSYRLIICTC